MNGKKSTMLPVPSALESTTDVVRIPEVLLNFCAGSLVPILFLAAPVRVTNCFTDLERPSLVKRGSGWLLKSNILSGVCARAHTHNSP